MYPVVWDKALSRAWSGKAWAYGGLNYACRLNSEDSLDFQLLPEQPPYGFIFSRRADNCKVVTKDLDEVTHLI